jgi:outer membrane lipoprotein LolB
MRFLGWFCLLCLAGCASTVPHTVSQPAQSEAPFAFNGRAAIKHDGERTSANLHWVHRTDFDEILLMGPLGQTVARIQSDENGVTLDTSDQHYAAQNAESLTHQVLGWSLPLFGLRYWVQAIPAPEDQAQIKLNANGQMLVLQQAGWTIRYVQYATPETDSLPMRMSLQHQGLEILLVINEWEAQ